ncbi:protein FAM227B-like isoform X2 [Mobula birostris]|uniref:protein FAM227B-like isoform X2 n=1 Tax=Mobula birostris TaxID=1983395 RepID=UPI003B28C9E7
MFVPHRSDFNVIHPINSETTGNTLQKMGSLPKTYDEFLQFQGLDWPLLLPDEDEFNMNIQPEAFTSYESVSQYVHEHAPLQMELLINMGQRIDEFALRLEKYASKILPDEPRKSKANAKTHSFYLPESN